MSELQLDMVLLFTLLISALWTVMTVRLIRAIVGLALTSAVLSMIMYRLSSPLAAVFELSVCAGLISVIFVTTVSFTQRVSKERLIARRKERFMKFWYLPFILVAGALVLVYYTKIPKNIAVHPKVDMDVRNMLWNIRHLDLLGQIILLLTGSIGVVVLFKEFKDDKS